MKAMQNKEQYVYNCLKRVNPRVAYVPLEDVMQEIRYALLVSGEEDFLRVSARLVNRLIRAYGKGAPYSGRL